MHQLEEYIRFEAEKLLKRHQKYARVLIDESRRRARRTASPPAVVNAHEPSHWTCDSGFNPYYVRTRVESMAYALEKSIRAGTYRPRPAVGYQVPKIDGTLRDVSVFQIADSALSRLVFKSLSKKNGSLLGSRCYAYRTDLTVHDAILHIASEFRGRDRIFIAEYDFRKYFDQITHDHILKIFRDRMLFISSAEEQIVRSFLRAPTLSISNYNTPNPSLRERGIPQGTSISLFLANAAASPIDKRLERLGVGFARYADDTVIWSSSYAEICRAAEELAAAASEMGVEVNLLKSEGIRVLTPSGAPAEMKSTTSISFLAHRIDSKTIGIKGKKIASLKKHITYLMYVNLLQPLIRGVFNSARILPNFDRDYLVFIMQLRRYLYGSVSETQLRRHLAGDIPLLRFYGLMSFYPTITDEDQLIELDGWLLSSIHRTLVKRAALFRANGVQILPLPHDLDRNDLLPLHSTTSSGTFVDLRIPSFRRIAALVRNTAQVYGPTAVAHPSTRYYS